MINSAVLTKMIKNARDLKIADEAKTAILEMTDRATPLGVVNEKTTNRVGIRLRSGSETIGPNRATAATTGPLISEVGPVTRVTTRAVDPVIVTTNVVVNKAVLRINFAKGVTAIRAPKRVGVAAVITSGAAVFKGNMVVLAMTTETVGIAAAAGPSETTNTAVADMGVTPISRDVVKAEATTP